MSYFQSTAHALLPPVVDPMSYRVSHRGMGLTNAGSCSLPGMSGTGLGAEDTPSKPMCFLPKWAILTGINFVLLWLFIKEFGIALVIAGVLGAVEAGIS